MGSTPRSLPVVQFHIEAFPPAPQEKKCLFPHLAFYKQVSAPLICKRCNIVWNCVGQGSCCKDEDTLGFRIIRVAMILQRALCNLGSLAREKDYLRSLPLSVLFSGVLRPFTLKEISLICGKGVAKGHTEERRVKGVEGPRYRRIERGEGRSRGAGT